jgi:hypothetical protein
MPQRLDDFLSDSSTDSMATTDSPELSGAVRLDQFLGSAQPQQQPQQSIDSPTDHAAAAYMTQHGIVAPDQVQATFTAFRQLASGNTGPAHLVSPQESQRQQITADNAGRGVLASNLIELLHPAAGLFARGERMLAPAMDLVSPDAAANMRTSATSLESTRGNGGLSNLPGQLLGQVTTFANPLVAAASGGNEAFVEDEAAKERGENVGTLDEVGHVAGKAALDALFSKAFTGTPGKSAISQAEKAVGGFMTRYAPEYVAKYGAKAAVGALTNDAVTLIGNTLTQGTVNPNQQITQGLGASTVLGAGLPVVHEAASSLMSRTKNQPTADNGGNQQVEAGPQENGVVHTPDDRLAPQQAYDARAENDRLMGQLGQEVQKWDQLAKRGQSKPASEFPATLDNSEAVGKWYGEQFKDEGNAPIIQTLASQSEGKYVLANVPPDRLDVMDTMAGDTQPDKVNAIRKLAPEQRADLPPVIAVGGSGDKLMVADGGHRTTAAQEAGEASIRAYVPESYVGKNGIEAVGEKLPSPGKLANAETTLSPEGAAKLGEITNPESPVGKPTRPALAARRAGFVTTPTREDLIGPGSIYHEEVQPKVQRAAASVGEWIGKIRNAFPIETGSGDVKTANTFRSHFSRATLDQAKAEIAFEDSRKAFDKLGTSDQWEFQRRMDANEPQVAPDLQKVADAMYADTNEGRQRLVSLGNEAAKDWQEQWWNRLWKPDPAKAQALKQQLFGPGKVEGEAGFLKKRSIENWEDALNQGLVPKFDNPAEMFLASRMERQKYIAGFGAMKELADSNTFRRITDPNKVPTGWTETPAGAKGPLKQLIPGDGKVYAPEEVNRILSNVVNPSAIGNSPTFRLAMDVNNTLTQAALGLSGFHVRKVTQELINLQVGRAIEQGLKGEGAAAKDSLLQAPKSPFLAVKNGSDVQRKMLGLAPATPAEHEVFDFMTEGGARAKGDSIYETQWKRKFDKALSDGGVQGVLRAIGHSPFALNEALMQKGVFSYVQHAKLFLGAEMSKDALGRLHDKYGPDIPIEKARSESAKIQDHLDNVLGLMVRDNLFWNRTARDIATLSTLSVGWNYGSGRELAGGVYDLGKGIGSLAKGRKLADVDGRRIGYLMSTAALTALTGAFVTYATTGHGPRSLTDYVYPPTGEKDRNEHDVRLNTGFYTSDWFDFIHSPGETLKNKGSPLMHAALALATNKDYAGTKIRNEDDHWYTQAAQVAKYLASSAEPFSVKQLIDTIQGGGSEKKSLTMKMLPFAGFKTAKKTYSMSDAENVTHELMARHYEAGGRTQAQAEKSTLISQLGSDIHSHEPGAYANLRAAVKSGQIAPGEQAKVNQRAQRQPGLAGLLKDSSLTPDELMQVWGEATPDERKKIVWVLRGRVVRSESLDPETRSKYLKQLSLKGAE